MNSMVVRYVADVEDRRWWKELENECECVYCANIRWPHISASTPLLSSAVPR